MFPNLKAELARAGITHRELASRLNERGVKIALSTLSQKMNGKFQFTLDEAEAIREAVGTSLTLEVLFERAKA